MKFGILVFRAENRSDEGTLIGFVKANSEKDASEKLNVHGIDEEMWDPHGDDLLPRTYWHELEFIIRLSYSQEDDDEEPGEEKFIEISSADDLHQILVRIPRDAENQDKRFDEGLLSRAEKEGRKMSRMDDRWFLLQQLMQLYSMKYEGQIDKNDYNLFQKQLSEKMSL